GFVGAKNVLIFLRELLFIPVLMGKGCIFVDSIFEMIIRSILLICNEVLKICWNQESDIHAEACHKVSDGCA
ncbi:MAG: hypothetical protein D3910_22875, partial [Candidatus Electrothrix sp. ATG2]|nr:hypothetical protein [Candidatus Electrothrix sp. ATG2]